MSNQKQALELLLSAEKLQAAGRLEEAEAACRKALTLTPNHPAILHLLGVILGRLGKSSQSLEVLRQTARLQPDSAMVRHNYAFSLKSTGSFDDAIREFQQAIKLDPKMAAAHSNLGIVYKDQGKLEEAKACYRRAIELKPDYADAHWNLSLVLLRQGNFKEGLVEYEWRRHVRTAAPVPNLPIPPWNGEELNGKAVVLYPEQGLGDAIQFTRYIPMVQQRGGRVVVACPPSLRGIFARSFPLAQFVNFGGNFPPIDLQSSLVSLPLVFGTDLNSIPATISYLETDSALVAKWAARLGERDGRLRVGFVWAGNPAHYNDQNRSIPIEELRPISQMKEIAAFSLQKDKRADQVAPAELIDFTAEFSDFDETAAFIENLDVVVTVDTAVAHLAGAIGKATWMLLPFVTDWRWLIDRADTPWYPTMRLFRQRAIGDWPQVVRDVAGELQALANRGRP